MTQLPFHAPNDTPPPHVSQDFPLLIKLSDAYKLWHNCLVHLPRPARYSLGIKIDNLFTETLELIFLAGYSPKAQKLAVVYKTSTRLDTLKFFLKIIWEIKALDNKKYIQLSQPLTEIGKMLGGWIKQLQKETLPNNGRE